MSPEIDPVPYVTNAVLRTTLMNQICKIGVNVCKLFFLFTNLVTNERHGHDEVNTMLSVSFNYSITNRKGETQELKR